MRFEEKYDKKQNIHCKKFANFFKFLKNSILSKNIKSVAMFS